MSKLNLVFVFLAALLLPGSVYSQPTKVLPAKTAKVTKVPAAAKAAPASVPLAHAALLAPAKVAPAASQPVAVTKAVAASQPTVFVPVAASNKWSWIVANTGWLIPLILWLLANLATALSPYPKARGVVSAIRMFMGGLALVEFKDGKKPGLAFKLPVTLPAPPPEPPKA